MRTRVRTAVLGGVAAVALAWAAAVPAHAGSLVAAAGQDGSADITLRFVGNVSGADATLITVYPSAVVRTPPFYPADVTGVSEGCGFVQVPTGLGTGSANSGSAFGTTSYDATTNVTTMVVTLQNALAVGPWAVVVAAGAVSPDSVGCVHFVATL